MRRTSELAIGAIALLGFIGASCGSDKDAAVTTAAPTTAAATTTAGAPGDAFVDFYEVPGTT